MDENLDLTKNIDINQALKEFEEKSKSEQMQKAPEASKNSEMPKMVRMVMKLSGGAIKEQRQAEYILLGFVFVVIFISLFLFFRGTSKNTSVHPVLINPEWMVQKNKTSP